MKTIPIAAPQIGDEERQAVLAVLDSGHTHNFSIRADLLSRWAGIQAETLADLGSILVNRAEVPLRAASSSTWR